MPFPEGFQTDSSRIPESPSRPVPTPPLREVRDCDAPASRPLDGSDAATVWALYSRFPREAGIAGRRWVMFAPRLPHLPMLYAIAEAAVEGHHAAGSLIEPYLRSRCARIGESLREIQKGEENARPERIPAPHRGFRTIADILGGAR